MLEDFSFASIKEKFNKDKRFKIIVISSGTIVVSALLLFGYYKLFYQPADEESQKIYTEAINNSSDFNTLTALNYNLKSVDNSKKTEFPSDSSRNDSLRNMYKIQIDDIKANISKQIRTLESNIEEYDGYSGELSSKFVLCTYYLKNGEAKKALELLESLDEVNDTFLSAMIPGLKGDCYSDLANYSEAFKFYTIAYNTNPNDFTTPMYLWKAGLVAEKLNQFKEASYCFNKLKNDYSTVDFVRTKRLDFHLEKSKNTSVR